MFLLVIFLNGGILTGYSQDAFQYVLSMCLYRAHHHSIYITSFSKYSCKIFVFLSQQIVLLDFCMEFATIKSMSHLCSCRKQDGTCFTFSGLNTTTISSQKKLLQKSNVSSWAQTEPKPSPLQQRVPPALWPQRDTGPR